MRTIRLVGLLLLLCGRVLADHCHSGDDWRECHDLSLAELEAEDEDQGKRGFKLISLDMANASPLAIPSGRRYAAVWIRDAEARQIKQFDLSFDTVVSMVDEYAGRFSPIIVTSGDGIRFAMVLEKGAPRFALHRGNADEFSAENSRQREAGRKLVWFKTYSAPAQIVGVWLDETDSEITPSGWAWRSGDTRAEYANAVDAFKAGHMRTALASPGPTGNISSLFYDFNLGSWAETVVEGDAALDSVIASWRDQNKMPIAVQAVSVNGQAKMRYAATAVETAKLRGNPEHRWTGDRREWRTDPPNPPALGTLDGIDGIMRKFMTKFGVRAASVAVVKNDKLQFARAYTYAESDYPTTKRSTAFRLASCSKTMTSLLTLQILESTPKLNLQTPVLEFLGIPDTRHAADGKRIQIQHLLSHTSGLERNEGGSMGADRTIAAGLRKEGKKVSLPLQTEEALRFGLLFDERAQPEFRPGEDEQYSNFAYSLLGLVLDKFTKDFFAAMRNGIIEPLGMKDTFEVRFKNLSASNQLPGIARPHMREPRLYTTVLNDSEEWVLGQYGGENWARGFGAHGFFSSAPDQAKFLGSLLSKVAAKNRPVKSENTYNLLLQRLPGHRDYTLSGFVVPSDERTYLSKSGEEIGTHCITFFPYSGKPAFDDLAAVVLIDTDVNLVRVADDLYDLFRQVDEDKAWPHKDLFPELGIPKYKD